MKSPAFQFYPGDYLSSPDVALMSLLEEAAYLRLLMYSWQQEKIGYLPNNEQHLRRFTKMTTEQWAESRDILLKKFPATEDEAHRFNPRLLMEVEKQRKYREKSSEGGKKSAERRWGKKNEEVTPLPENVSTLTSEVSALTKMDNQNVTLPFSSSISEEINTTVVEGECEREEVAATAAPAPENSSALLQEIKACPTIELLTALWKKQEPQPAADSAEKQAFSERRREIENPAPKPTAKSTPAAQKREAVTKQALGLPLPYPSEKFLEAWQELLKQPAQKKKTLSAHQTTLRLLADLENEQVALESITTAISAGYQIVVTERNIDRAKRLNESIMTAQRGGQYNQATPAQQTVKQVANYPYLHEDVAPTALDWLNQQNAGDDIPDYLN